MTSSLQPQRVHDHQRLHSLSKPNLVSEEMADSDIGQDALHIG
jgi:hypothetical protein